MSCIETGYVEGLVPGISIWRMSQSTCIVHDSCHAAHAVPSLELRFGSDWRRTTK